MNPNLILFFIAGYFCLLMLIARITSRRARQNAYFDGDRSSPWFLVAFGMIGSGISAVSLVSIPGNVGNNQLFYFQFILGNIAGYLFIAFVLTPLFHKLKVISIYSYLGQRYGAITYKTGSALFMVSQSFGAAFRLLLSVKILQTAFFDGYHIPYYVTVLIVLVLIWLYTHQSGVKTIVWTDALQSFFLLSVIIISIFTILHALDLSLPGLFRSLRGNPHAQVFDWHWKGGSNFFKQFISGMLITVALVGLDQSMMQKTLTIHSAAGARKNVLTFSFFIAFAQTLFLGLGILLYLYVEQKGISIPKENGMYTHTDALYPFLTQTYFGKIGAITFFIGVVASTFATIDSCITALTTAFSFDFIKLDQQPEARRKILKNRVLIGVNIVIFCIVMGFWNSHGAIINTIFTIAGYTYGPLLGLYLLGLFSNISLKDKWVPLACLAAPLLSFLLNKWLTEYYNFDPGFFIIGVNAAITIVLLLLLKSKSHAGRLPN
jgi:Na+/proline symporter